jgi:AcrR family transcriptional regulator
MSTNRSVIRTKNAIRQAFIEFLSETQAIDKITIIELTDKANIVRSTYYSHHEDIYAVAKEIQSEISDAFKDAIERYVEKGNNLKTSLTVLMDFFAKREKAYKLLFTSGYNENHFFSALKGSLSKELYDKLAFENVEFFNNDKMAESSFYGSLNIEALSNYFNGRSN